MWPSLKRKDGKRIGIECGVMLPLDFGYIAAN